MQPFIYVDASCFSNPCQDLDGLMSDVNLMSSTPLGKGSLGKGSGKGGLVKGVGKGKGKKGPQLALEDAPPEKTLDEQIAMAEGKCRKMRDLCLITLNNIDEALLAVKKSKYWSKSAQKDAEALKGSLEDEIKALKKVLNKKDPDLDELKESMIKAATVVKECNVAMKEYKQIANKTSSVASKRS